MKIGTVARASALPREVSSLTSSNYARDLRATSRRK
jgi:hypothetical protein